MKWNRLVKKGRPRTEGSRVGWMVWKKQQKGKESNESECVYTDEQRPSRLNEINSLCEGLKAFKQTEEQDISKEG